ncbi:polymer-forming cytoskeletal protein [Reichenbachiella sp. 5M10]|uniref:bactofilin family protein n=1 Tax=Reichenbachiella sp. 5M10 TaxID=1889772 RepID=UPI0026C2D98C
MKEVEELSNSSNIIGKGTVLTGDIETFGNIRIEGKIVGNMKTKSKAACGHSSHIEGNILAQNAEIAGTVTGKLEVSELLILKPSAVINGDIITNKLIVESGATFNGGCKMGVTIKEIKIGEQAEEQTHIRKAE